LAKLCPSQSSCAAIVKISSKNIATKVIVREKKANLENDPKSQKIFFLFFFANFEDLY